MANPISQMSLRSGFGLMGFFAVLLLLLPTTGLLAQASPKNLQPAEVRQLVEQGKILSIDRIARFIPAKRPISILSARLVTPQNELRSWYYSIRLRDGDGRIQKYIFAATSGRLWAVNGNSVTGN